MREIKFRAWHKEKKEMGEVRNIDFISEIVQAGYQNKYGVWNFEDIEQMQFTGLQDCNGVDIYEGDIIELCYEYFDGNFSENECKGKVFFEGSSFKMNYKKYDEIWEWRLDEPDILSIEVIGNIYENSELLEVGEY